MADRIRVFCPHCQAVYHLKVGPTPDGKLNCAKCGADTVVPVEAPGSAAPIGRLAFAAAVGLLAVAVVILLMALGEGETTPDAGDPALKREAATSGEPDLTPGRRPTASAREPTSAVPAGGRPTLLDSAEKLAKQAAEEAKQGRFAEAGAIADTLATVMPDSPWGHYALAFVAYKKEDFATARDHLEQALERDPSHADSKSLRLDVVAAVDELQEWEKLLDKAARTKDWDALVGAGDKLLDAGWHKRAAETYRRALRLMAAEADALTQRQARTRKKLDRVVAALSTSVYSKVRHSIPRFQVQGIAAEFRRVYGLSAEFLRVHGLSLHERIHFDGSRLSEIDLHDCGEKVSHLKPLRDMPLQRLNCSRTGVSDLSPLKGMPLTQLDCSETPVKDLAPLKGMPLVRLDVSNTGVSDLGPLEGMPLTHLKLGGTAVGDVRALKGMGLEELYLQGTKVTDLTPLTDMKLRLLRPPSRNQLTPESLALIERFQKQSCKVVWEK